MRAVVEAGAGALRQARGANAGPGRKRGSGRKNAASGHRHGLRDKCALSVSKRSYTRPMWQPGALSRTVLALIWLVLGIAMIAVSVWLGWTRWLAILNGHLAMLIAGI